MERLRSWLNDGRAWLERLSARERKLVLLAAGAALAFLLFVLIFSFASSASAARRRTQDKLAKLEEVHALAASYREAEQSRQAVEQQLTAGSVSLISYIEEKANAANLEVPSMAPKGDVGIGDGRIIESAVELTFTDVTLPKLVSFLQGVERGPGVVKVKYLRIEPRPAADTLTAWTTIATYRMKP